MKKIKETKCKEEGCEKLSIDNNDGYCLGHICPPAIPLILQHLNELKEKRNENDGEKNEMHEGFAKHFSEMNDEELISAFNQQVGNSGWTSSRGHYLSLMREEFEKRGFDYSSIGDSSSVSYKDRIVLVSKKIEQEVQSREKEVTKEEFKRWYLQHGKESGYIEEGWNNIYEKEEGMEYIVTEPTSKDENRMFVVSDGKIRRMFLTTEEEEESFFDQQGNN